jgi:DNA-directed RNA polymerase specialized sigma24 family protein
VAVDPEVDFEAFVAARLPALLRFGRALTGSEHATAGLVQDALELLRKVRSCDLATTAAVCGPAERGWP